MASRPRTENGFTAAVNRLTAASPLSLRLIKELMYRGLSGEFDAHMERHLAALLTCFRSEDHEEGVASFLERREAKFVGR